jgi:sortase A
MKILIRGKSPQRVLRWTERMLFGAAFVLLGYGGFVLADTWIFQRQESAALERFVPEQSPEKNAESVAASAIGPDGLIGRLELPRLSVSVIVAEGTTSKVLRHAVGHIAGTALPGQAGNIGIAGHRDSFFRPLRNIQQEDVIELTTARGIYRYRVVSTKVVKPEDTAVLDSDGREILTLVTCYPFYFVGSAPERFIVRAERVAI